MKDFDALGGVIPVMGDELIRFSENELKSLERDLGVVFPIDYRSFMLEYGASAFGGYIGIHPVKPLPENISSNGDGHFGYFYGPESAIYGITYSLANTIHVLAPRMPASVIPIGDDSGGNQFCLGVRGLYYGKVYYWDHDREWDEEEFEEEHGVPMTEEDKFSNAHLVAESFDDFLSRLYLAD